MNKKLNLITIAAIVMICAITIITIALLLANADMAFGKAANSIVTLYPGETLTVICDGERMTAEVVDDLTSLIFCEGAPFDERWWKKDE